MRRAAILGFLGIVVGAVATILSSLITTSSLPWQHDDTPSTTAAEPRVRDVEVEWVGIDGRYAVSGIVDNLIPGQLIWTYNQLRGETPGPVYADFGPCPVDDDGRFRCELGWAGEPRKDDGRTFAIWVAVVSDEDAYEAASLKSNFLGTSPWPNVNSVPHVDGAETMVMVEKTRPMATQTAPTTP